MRARHTAALISSVLLGCEEPATLREPAFGACVVPLSLPAQPDPGAPGEEAYLCFGFDVPRATSGEMFLQGVEILPADSAVVTHHVAMFATSSDFSDGPVRCEQMPEDALELSVWVPGSGALRMPEGAAIAFPDGASRLVLQAHVMRVGEGPAGPLEVQMCLTDARPEHVGAWMPVRAPVPVIPPHQMESRSKECELSAALHLFSVWPHMHRIGTEFHGILHQKDGGDLPIVEVVPWDAGEQRTYFLGLDLAAGDRIETTCVWQNNTEQYVLPGPGIEDEMCSQSFIAWPREAARCAP